MPRKTEKVPLFESPTTECPRTKIFQADTEFVIGLNRIGWIGPQFQKLARGVVERNVPSVLVTRRPLNRLATASEICKTVGKSRAIRLAHLKHLLRTKEESFLAVVLVKGKLWAVDACWNSVDREWGVGARSVSRPGEWRSGYRVVSQVK